MDLEAVPGVGTKTAEALASLEDPEGALEAGDVAAIARAPGISEGRAARIARGAIRARHDDPGGFLATDRAAEIYRTALGLLQERTVTDYAARRLETIYPTGVRSRIEEVRALSERAMAREVDDGVLDALADVSPVEPPQGVRVRDRCLATTDAETYAEATEMIPEISVELVEDESTLADLARGYATVIALEETFVGVDVQGDVRVQPDALESPAAVVPERTLAFFAANRERIRAAVAVHRAAGLDPPGDPEDGGEMATLESALEGITAEGEPAGDAELQRLARAIEDLDAAVSMAETVANDHLRGAIEERDVTIEGTDLLSLVERGAGVDSLLDRELADEYAAAVEKARDHLVDALDLQDTTDLARRAFPDDPTYPVAHDEDVVSRLRDELTATRDRRAERRKRELADALAAHREDSEALVDAALELDVELAIARFAADFSCTLPAVEGTGIAIEGGRSPLIEEPFGEVVPVDYAVEGVGLLSGVNSGGKTSTLDLLALVAVLAHAGLPVPAERARVAPIDELHYHAKTQGTLDAGAFEATLRSFADLVTGLGADDTEALVLVDELESITEPGAAATIIAGILEELDARGATALFVSHLAGDVRVAAETDLAVDGIQAEGLEDGELVVDRSPVPGTLARSTPELIVEKLADGEHAANGGEPAAAEEAREFYAELLEKFE
jgi:dsDNA-specific endonuclease/ATPase MutS2